MKSQFCVAAIVLLGSLGLIAFKQASLRTSLAPTPEGLISLVLDPLFLLSMLLLLASRILWAIPLRDTSLTVLYAAVTSLTIILTQLMALPLYGETLTPTQILGIVITVGGVVIATL